MTILGLNAYHGDASAALVVDGKLVCAIEEERLNRIKHSAGFPSLAVQECLRMGGISALEIDAVALSRNPRARLLSKCIHVCERLWREGSVSTLADQLRNRLQNRRRVSRINLELAEALGVSALRAKTFHVEHHLAHLASAFFASPFSDAAVLSLDGFGDFVSTMWGVGHDRNIDVYGEIRFPHSLGVLYTAVTQWLGFPKYGDEGKVMGLAAYGNAKGVPELRALLQFVPDGTFRLDLRFFRHHVEGIDLSWESGQPRLGTLYSEELLALLGPAFASGEAISERQADVAASLQSLLEDAVVHVALALQRKTGQRRLALAGGVALNSVANGKVLDRTPFRELFVQPAAGDNGTSIGAALYVANQIHKAPRRFVMHHAYTGPAFSDDDCERAVSEVLGPEKTESAWVAWVTGPGNEKARVLVEPCSFSGVVKKAVEAICAGKVVGWFQGAMEFGPRALGHRSIVCDPRRPDMKDILNRRIKHREPFRPFAPAILAEATTDWFVRAAPSPAMLLVDMVRPEKRALVPAVVHADGSGRLQTVERAHSPTFYALIEAFAAQTGVPMLLNTSFNEHEPIVCTPTDALRCFLKTRMDALALSNLWVYFTDEE